MEPSGTKAAWISLAVAAMVGASVAAVSAYILHMRAMEQMQFHSELETIDQRLRNKKARGASRRRKSTRDTPCSSSQSLPEIALINGTDNGKYAREASGSSGLERADSLASMSGIPPGLPRVQTRRDGRLLTSGPHLQ